MDARELFLNPELEQKEIYEYLGSLGFRDSHRADQHLEEIVQLLGAHDPLVEISEALFESISSSADPDAALRHFLAFLEASPSPLNLLSLLSGRPEALQVLLPVLGGSPFLTQNLVRNPEYFYWLLEGGRLERVESPSYFKEAAESTVRPFPDLKSRLDALRRLQRRESLRIGAQDLLGLANLTGVVRQVSALADAILDQTYRCLARDRLGKEDGFAVLGLGKLGGFELNFSSDVDLIFICSGEVEGKKIIRFAKEYLRELSEFTAEGNLYRIDLRLRPMGQRGEIVYTEEAALQYYQTWADTTDRLALIKCRPVAGDRELGERFVDSIQHFVFKKYLDHAAVEEIGAIKRRTDRQLRQRNESRSNVKLGLGGIREIEFFVQSFQILFAGVQPQLKTPNTLEALDKLVDFGHIETEIFESLREAYLFLRSLEHKLQLVHDLQTHSLPESDWELQQLARRMGFQDDTEAEARVRFQEELNRHNEEVRRIFDSLFDQDHEERGLGEVILNSQMDPQEVEERLRQWGVPMVSETCEGIELLKQASAFPHSPSRLRNLLANLLPLLLQSVRRYRRPRDLFSRFDRFCEALGSRAPMYAELIENSELADRLFRILSTGTFLAETLVQNPELLDSLATPSPGGDPWEELEKYVRDHQKETPRNALRRFKRREEFKIAALELEEPGQVETRKHLSTLAEAALHLAWKECLEEVGFGTEECPHAFLALGKLAGGELVFHSDLDLIFLARDVDEELRTLFSQALRCLRRFLHEYTEAGRAYEVDFRLRPEGTHSSEVVSLSQWDDYFETRLEAWERLAYAKTRVVLRSHFDFDLQARLFSQRFSDEDRASLRHVRERKQMEIGREKEDEVFHFKVGRGALLDIQFATQYLQIQNEVYEPNLLKALNKLRGLDLLSQANYKVLQEAARFYYALESIQDLVAESSTGQISHRPEDNEVLAAYLGLDSGEALLEKYRALSQEVRAGYREILEDPEE